MKKNVSGQKVGAQMVSATDGSIFSAAVTVAVTIDAGTQATGTVGSGACTHEGNGYHTYAPAQAETNGDLIAFTFTGSGAVPVTVQIYTDFPQTGDAYSSVVAGVTVSSINTDVITSAALASSAVTEIQTGLATSASTAVLATSAALATVAGYIDTEVAAIKTVTDALPNGGALTSLAQSSVLATVLTNTTNIEADTQDIQARLPAALSSAGYIKAQVLEMGAGTITSTTGASGWLTAAQFAANAITAAAVAADVSLEIWGTLETDISVASSIGVKLKNVVPVNPTKGVAYSNFTFIMRDTSDVPATGLTVTCNISKDGAAFAASTNAVSEISNGAYKLNLTSTEFNADEILLRFSATGAKDLFIKIRTQKAAA